VFKTIWRRRPLLALIVLILLLVIGYAGKAVTSHSEQQNPSPTTSVAARSDVVALSGLPKQAADTVRLIQRGGPFPFAHDGIVYQNLEHNLPAKPRGYYHEYTVVTPGSDDRGARRIITGKNGEWFYTADHYASFVRVDVTG
jgi:ribonuclease T1